MTDKMRICTATLVRRADFPPPFDVAIYDLCGNEAVLYSDVPEQVRRNFKEHQFGAACPVADEGRDYAYYVDYEVWLVRLLRAALAAKIGSHRQ